MTKARVIAPLPGVFDQGKMLMMQMFHDLHDVIDECRPDLDGLMTTKQALFDEIRMTKVVGFDLRDGSDGLEFVETKEGLLNKEHVRLFIHAAYDELNIREEWTLIFSDSAESKDDFSDIAGVYTFYREPEEDAPSP